MGKRYEYKMIQVPPTIELTSKKRGNEAAQFLEGIVNQHSRVGWEFYRIDSMTQIEPQGCLGFGGNRIVTYHIITFRIERE